MSTIKMAEGRQNLSITVNFGSRGMFLLQDLLVLMKFIANNKMPVLSRKKN